MLTEAYMRRWNMSQEHIEEILSKYQSGVSICVLSQNTGHCMETIKHILLSNGITLRSRMEIITKYHPNHSAFNTINTEEAAYWLGFIASDGCIMGNQIHIALSADDTTHLEKFARWFSPGYPIRTYRTKQGYNQSRFYATSDEATSALAKYGIVPRKTWSFSHIPAIDNGLIRHFLRGYLDGDGWITRDKENVYKAGFCSMSRVFLSEVQDWLNLTLSLKEAVIVPSGSVWVYPKAGKQAIAILHHLYSNATVYLDRKYTLALAAISRRDTVCQSLGITIDEYARLEPHEMMNLHNRRKQR